MKLFHALSFLCATLIGHASSHEGDHPPHRGQGGLGDYKPANQTEVFPKNYSDAFFARDCVGREDELLFVLTFDDGPYNQTNQFLDILKEKEAPAAFFMSGINFNTTVANNVAQRMIDEGHTLANHGMEHEDPLTVQEASMMHDIILEKGYEMSFFRPPGGRFTEEIFNDMVAMDYSFVMWNLDTLDWFTDQITAEAVLAQVEVAVQNPTAPAEAIQDSDFPRRGSIILLGHDIQPTMLSPIGNQTLLAAIIDTVRDAGYEVVSLDECLSLADKTVDPSSGSWKVGSDGYGAVLLLGVGVLASTFM